MAEAGFGVALEEAGADSIVVDDGDPVPDVGARGDIYWQLRELLGGTRSGRSRRGCVESGVAVADGTVFFGRRHNAYAVDAATGDEEWSFATEGDVRSGVAVADGTVFFGSRHNAYAVTADDTARYTGPRVSDGTEWVRQL